MSPKQLFLTTLRGQRADRVPISLEGFRYRYPADVQAIEDPARREIALRVWRLMPYLLGGNSGVNRYLVTPAAAMREVSRTRRDGNVEVVTRIGTPKGDLSAVTCRDRATDTWWTKKYPCEDLLDIERIRSVPWEVSADVGPPDSQAGADYAERGIAAAHVSSPFVCVAGMMPYEYFLELCATQCTLIAELTELCLRRILDLLEVVLAKKSVEYAWIGGCEWITPPMGSPELYKALAHEYERPIIERFHRAGALVHVHCHGKVRSTLELVIDRGADFFEPMEPPPDGDITLAEAKRIAAGRITLGGNVEARVLANEDAAAVEHAARAAFEGGKERMVFQTSAGPIGPMSERMRTNYHRLIDVWEELSGL